MFDLPKTKEEAAQKRYNRWGGNPKGNAYDPKRCAYEIWDNHLTHQCSRKNGHGPDELYCKQHDPAAIAARDAARKERHDKEWNERRKEIYGKTFYNALKQIADGHNDARALAKDVLEKFHNKT